MLLLIEELKLAQMQYGN